jgi:hypothetical protein
MIIGNMMIMTRQRRFRNFVFISWMGATLISSACAAMQPPNAGPPESGGQPYPVVFGEQPQRREASMLALNRLALANVREDQTQPYLQPVTATIKSLPANLSTPLYLPKVGVKPEMNEDEIREALRRFIDDWRNLIGADPSQLSLTERIDQPNGVKLARYEQRPFRYPLRGDYGKLEIQFTADRRLLNVSSTCIPDAERLQPALVAITPRLKAQEVVQSVLKGSLTYTDSAGNRQTYSLSANNKIDVGELVTYVRASKDRLELLVAWEIKVSNAPFKNVYIDAVTNEIIAVR